MAVTFFLYKYFTQYETTDTSKDIGVPIYQLDNNI